MRTMIAMAVVLAACGGEAAPPDAAPVGLDGAAAQPACTGCTADQICVQLIDGTCQPFGASCVTRVQGCDPNTCSPGCDQAYCTGTVALTCNAAPCTTAAPDAYHCYGP